MKISSLVDIVGGTLLNSPAISFITQIHTKLHKINDGDLFISSNQDEINNAILRGAFCIITDMEMNINDTEIAWIKVDSIQKATIKILRFLLANIELQSYYVSSIHLTILQALTPDKNKYIFVNNPMDLIENIFTITSSNILLSTNKSLLLDLYPRSIAFDSKEHTINNLTVHSLFEMSFTYNDSFYSRIKFSYVYLNHLLDVQRFYQLTQMDENKVKNIALMEPIFLNKSLQIIEFGKSNKFILTSNDESIATLEKKFITQFYTYGKIDMVDVEHFDEQTIYNIIAKSKANCLYLTHCSKEQISHLLNKFAPKEQLLF